jgi:NAD(P)-dependent dehydrogenase (short-subunit alcohol dehydrogenase family)
MKSRAMLVGNSDGIGLASTRRLLAAGWDVIGVSKSESPITSTAYHHRVADVSDNVKWARTSLTQGDSPGRTERLDPSTAQSAWIDSTRYEGVRT